ncbi:MAG: HD domain-containing protein [Candidatus Nomurabacteria bacterium]|nr:HD domain-containing protein [Candidatus Nomurabacteria bacterium]
MKYIFDLKYSELAPDVIKSLSELPRTGWVDRKVTNPETVQEHIIAVRELVISEIQNLDDFSPQEINETLDMLEVHDWPESDKKVGDIVIVTYDLEEKKRLKELKFKLELEAMTKICTPLGERGRRIFDLWMRFEKKEDRISIFANQVDKYQPFEKAFEYEERGEKKVSTQEFIDYSEKVIVYPALLRRLENLKLKLANLKKSH